MVQILTMRHIARFPLSFESEFESLTIIDSRRDDDDDDDDDDDVRNPPQQWRMEKPLQRCWQTTTSRPDGTVEIDAEGRIVISILKG